MEKKAATVRTALKLFYALPILFVLGVCGYLAWQRGTHQPSPAPLIPSRPFLSVPIDGLTANLFTPGNEMRAAGDDVFIEFRDAQTNLVDVGDVTLGLVLKMPGTVLHSIGIVLRTSTPGQYRSTLEPQMAGDWTANLGFKGHHGTVETNFTLRVH